LRAAFRGLAAISGDIGRFPPRLKGLPEPFRARENRIFLTVARA